LLRLLDTRRTKPARLARQARPPGSPARRACSCKNSPSSNLLNTKSPHWLQRVLPYLPPKLPLPVDRSPNPTTCLIPGPVRPAVPNGIRIRSGVFPQSTGQTDRQTNRWSAGMVCDYRPLSLYRQQRGLTKLHLHTSGQAYTRIFG